ncbi:BACON domain-containing carbohydrate-binding protein [uncultured Parabacteroides sp.]|uniref:BACON domain-containing protein n=1 Tax=uncultured Parabacteroides sp. TaxID=512312 RepID=UPI0025D2DF2B|nr:BACON domain-containing carbohydrate-binding protein [uncultured Parabacteroides sp.]
MKQILYIFSLLLLWGCEDEPTPMQIAVSTGNATNITTNSASIQVSMDKNDIINEIGVFCSTDSLFNSSTVNKSSTQEITGTEFNFQLSNLSAGTKYFYKAYASGKSNSIYGITKSFMTEQVLLSTSVNNIEASDKESIYKVEVRSNADWRTSSDQSWCEVSPDAGIQKDSINIKLKENTSTSARQAVVTVTAGTQVQKITINQKGCDENLSVSSNYFSVSPESGSYNFIIHTSLSWTISSDQPWCVPSSSSGNGENTLSFTTTENTLSQERNATLTIKAGTLTQKITVIQQSKSATLAVSTNTFAVNANRNTYNFTVTSNMNWTISCDQSWCVPSIAAGSNNQTVFFDVSENTSTQERSATITVKARNLIQKITVTQSGTNQALAVSKDSFIFGPEAGHGEFSITSNTNWAITSDQSWCNFATTSGSNNQTISFTITANTSTQGRTAIVNIKTSSSLIQITVTQEGQTEIAPNLSVSPESLSVTAGDQTSSFSISCNTNWTISSNQTWCTPSVTSGSGNKTITCSIAANTQSQTRTAMMTVNAGNLSKTVTVTQEGKVEVAIINIPDANFKAYLIEKFDTDKDGEISEEEASIVTSIWCDTMSINSLQGIEHFTSVLKIYCPGNKITSLDVSKNTKLRSLVCDFNQLASLNLGSNPNLQEIWCARNELTHLDISQCPNLRMIYCYANKLTSLDTHNNVRFTNISCDSNQIQSLDLSNNKELTILQCDWNKISNINLTQNIKLEILSCGYNSLSTLDISNNTKITSLQCSGMDGLSLYIKSGQEFKTYSIGNATVYYK